MGFTMCKVHYYQQMECFYIGILVLVSQLNSSMNQQISRNELSDKKLRTCVGPEICTPPFCVGKPEQTKGMGLK